MAGLFVILLGAALATAQDFPAASTALWNEYAKLNQHQPPDIDLPGRATFGKQVHAFREKLLEHTRTQSGADLGNLWATVFGNTYALAIRYEWARYPEAEQAVRQAWGVLGAAQCDDRARLADVSVMLAVWLTGGWASRQPVECAALLEEVSRSFLPQTSDQGKQRSAFFTPNVQREIIRASAHLDPETQAVLRAQAEAAITAQLSDESLPLQLRSSQLSRYAIQLYTTGQVERAGKLLDAWAKTHGEDIVFPDFYYARFFAAIRGAGGWGMATQMVNRVNQLVYEHKASAHDPFYKLLMKGYYANITQSDYELRRRASAGQIEPAAVTRPTRNTLQRSK